MLREVQDLSDAGLEFTAGLAPRPDWPECFAEWSKTTHLLIHNYFPPPPEPFVLNLASPGEESLSLCREALRLSAAAGAPFYSVHAGFAMTLRPEQLGDHFAQAGKSRPVDREAAEKAFDRNVRTLAREAADFGLRILLENNVVSEAHLRAGLNHALLMSTPDEIIGHLARWNDLPVGMLLDTGHAHVTARTLGFPPEDFLALGDRVEGLHLSDNDGRTDSNQPFGRSAWFAPHLEKFAGLPAVIEVYGLDAAGRREQWHTLQSLLPS